MQKNYNGSVVAWVAIIISIIAVVMAWFAFRHPGQPLTVGNLENQKQEITNQVLDQVHQEAALAGLSQRLSFMKTQLTANPAQQPAASQQPPQKYSTDQAAQDITNIQQGMQKTFQDATGKYASTWKQVNGDLSTLGTQLKNNNPDYSNTIQKIISEINSSGINQ